MNIPFNRPFITNKEKQYMQQALDEKNLAGNKNFTQQCAKFIETKFNIKKAFLTPSGTAALEMIMMLIGLKQGDEVIMPSYTFSSTANAVFLRGAEPVFVDIRQDTFTLDESLVEAAITKNTKAIMPVVYGGISSDIEILSQIAQKHSLHLIEDAAQGVDAKHNNKYIGSLVPLSMYSFHETKNHTAGEGGALLINDESFVERASFIQEKGTDRSLCLMGKKDFYTWIDIGSSYAMSNLSSALLLAQLENKDTILQERTRVYSTYHEALKPFIEKELIQIQRIPENSSSNHHGFFILLKDNDTRSKFILFLKEKGITAYFHFVPLHSSPMGVKLQTNSHELPATDSIASRILRLPMFAGMTSQELAYTTEHVVSFLNRL